MEFNGKVIIITGASSGIGAGTAEYLAKLGATLVLVGRSLENLTEVSIKCNVGNSPKPLIIQGDLTVETDVINIINKTIEHFGKLDVLINNAGKGASGSIENTSLAQYDDIMDTNVRGVYHLTMLAVPHLAKTNGNIVNVSSVAGLRSFVGSLAYATAKAAIDQFSRCIALELAPKNIRVNCVNPGVIVTDFHHRLGMDQDSYQKYLEHCKTTHPIGRAGNVQEVANTIAFLASDLATFVTGICMPIDGGRQAMCVNPR